MRKSILSAAGVAILFGWTIAVAAQETSKPVAAYRLSLSLHELEDGKKINTRQYAMNLVAGVVYQDLKIGTRVPIELKQGEMQYLDIGTSISARLVEAGGALQLDVRADLSNIASPEHQPPATMPLLRQLRINGSTVVTSDRPVVIGSVEDPNSKREYQLEVATTRVK